MRSNTYADRVWWARRGFVAAGAFLLLVVVLAVWIATSRNDTTAGPITSSTSIAAPDNGGGPSSTPPASTSTATPTDPAATAVPAAPPPDVTWALWKGIALPASSSAGPTNVHDGIAEGYAHTPEGALIAGVQIMYRGGYGSTHEVIDRQVVAGPGRDRLLTKRAAVDGSSGAPQIAGFKYANYSDARADIALVLQTKEGSLTSLLMSLSWDNGDWRLIPTLDGEIVSSATAVPNIAGYVSWSGVA